VSLIKLSEASRLVGKSDKTMYRYVSRGRLSVSVDEKGHKVVETSELQRVFGALHSTEKTSWLTTPLDENGEREALREVNRTLKELLSEKDKRIELLTYQTEQKKKNNTIPWVIVAVIISCLVVNILYLIPSPF
jgi:hypothetical protein